MSSFLIILLKRLSLQPMSEIIMSTKYGNEHKVKLIKTAFFLKLKYIEWLCFVVSADPVTVDFTHGLPMYHINSTGEPETPPPSYTEELAQPPYNPSVSTSHVTCYELIASNAITQT